MHRRLPVFALAALPLFFAACQNQPATSPATPAAAPAAAPAPASAAASGPGRNVGFDLAPGEAVGALQFDVQYTAGGRFVGDADAVACETRVEGALSSYNHITGEKRLRAAFAAVKGFSGPVRICDCRFQGDAKPEDFTITVNDSSTPDLAEIDPAPTIKVVLN